MDIYSTIQQELGDKKVQLIAVSKKNPVEAVMNLYHKGQRDFGENIVQELVAKAGSLPADIRWHMIGHLQKNKVRQVLPIVSMIQSVDSVALLELIDMEAGKIEKKIDILFEIKIAQEDSKYGFSVDELYGYLKPIDLNSFANINFCGVMGMASFTDDVNIVRTEFKKLFQCYATLKHDIFSETAEFNTISMGMSGDYKIAIEEGSTMVRIGSLIFGERVY